MTRDGGRLVAACVMILCSIAETGCNGPVRVVHPQPCPPNGVLSEQIPATLALPRREEAFIPPMPIPDRVKGNHAVIRLVIDTSGNVMQDSVTVCGVVDALYAQRLAEEVSQLRFRPGLMNARHVVAPTLLTHAF